MLAIAVVVVVAKVEFPLRVTVTVAGEVEILGVMPQAASWLNVKSICRVSHPEARLYSATTVVLKRPSGTNEADNRAMIDDNTTSDEETEFRIL